MSTTSLTNWSALPSRRARLFKRLLIVLAAVAVVLSGFSMLDAQPVAQGLAVGILALLVLHVCIVSPGRYDSTAAGISSVSRLAKGHWRVTTGKNSLDGSLQRVWRGWGWITLRIQPFGSCDSVTVTVWRCHASDLSWHALRAWTSWELAMTACAKGRP